MEQEELLQGEQGGQRTIQLLQGNKEYQKQFKNIDYFERGLFGKDGDRQSENVCRTWGILNVGIFSLFFYFQGLTHLW